MDSRGDYERTDPRLEVIALRTAFRMVLDAVDAVIRKAWRVGQRSHSATVTNLSTRPENYAAAAAA